MTFSGLLVHEVTILRPNRLTDRYGNSSKDWAHVTETDAVGWVSQRAASEDRANGREAQLSEWVLFLDPDVDIVGGDRVTWEGLTFEVDGPPNPAWTPRGPHHLEVPLKVVEG